MKRVLVAPLDWGLGHTARSIPLLTELERQGAQVIFAGNKKQVDFVKQHILPLTAIDLFGYDVHYSAIWPQWMKVGFQSMRLARIIEKEHAWLQEFVSHNHVDIVISDNRFGLYTKQCRSIFITHQLSIPAPIFRQAVNNINLGYINHFDECWVPDNPLVNLSGVLSTADVKHPRIGLLSRFGKYVSSEDYAFDLLFLLSGPEPQRGMLEKKLLALSANTDYRIALVRGVKEKNYDIPSHIQQYDLLNSKDLEELINGSEVIVCRSGYSSLMDLVLLQKKMFLVPTPGQPEQEYLSGYLHREYGIQFAEQKDLDSSVDLKMMKTLARRIPVKTGLNFSDFRKENLGLLQNEISRILRA